MTVKTTPQAIMPEDDFLREGLIDRLSQYLAADESAWNVRYNLGVALAHEGRLAEAAEHFRTVLKQAPKHLESMINLGGVHLALSQPAEALKIFTSALGVWDVPVVRSNLAAAYLQMGQFEEAIRHLRHTLEQEPDQPDAWTNLGSAYLHLEQLEQSAQASRRALTLNNDFAMAHNNLALALLGLEQIDQAKEHLQTALRLGYPVHHQLRQELGLS